MVVCLRQRKGHVLHGGHPAKCQPVQLTLACDAPALPSQLSTSAFCDRDRACNSGLLCLPAAAGRYWCAKCDDNRGCKDDEYCISSTRGCGKLVSGPDTPDGRLYSFSSHH